MEMNQTLTIILSIGIPMLAGFGWIISLIISIQKDLQKDIRTLEGRLSDDIRKLDTRLSHIEGYLMGRDQRTGTQDKK